MRLQARGRPRLLKSPPYETDEYIPMETGEDGLPVYVDILGEGTPASEGETGQPESSPPEESSQAETQ